MTNPHRAFRRATGSFKKKGGHRSKADEFKEKSAADKWRQDYNKAQRDWRKGETSESNS